MAQDIHSLLQRFKDDDPTTRLVRAALRVLPSSPELPPWRSLEEALRALEPAAPRSVLRRAEELAREDSVQRVLALADALDSSDAVITVLTSVGTALKLHKSRQVQVSDLLGLEQRQAADAVLKAAALAAMVGSLFPGHEEDRVLGLRDRLAGRSLLSWFVGLELALPFGEDAWSKDGIILGALLSDFQEEAFKRLARSLDAYAVADARRLLPRVAVELDEEARALQGRIDSLADAVISHLPGAQRFVDLMGDAVALGADAFPVYRLLVPRLVAEVCVRRALDEHEGRAPVGPIYTPLPPLPVDEPVEPAAEALPEIPSDTPPAMAPPPPEPFPEPAWTAPPLPPAPSAPETPSMSHQGFAADLSGGAWQPSSDLVFAEPVAPPPPPHARPSPPSEPPATPPPLPLPQAASPRPPTPVATIPQRGAPPTPPPLPMATPAAHATPRPEPPRPELRSPPSTPPIVVSGPPPMPPRPPARPAAPSVSPPTPPTPVPAREIALERPHPTPSSGTPIQGRKPLAPASAPAPQADTSPAYRLTPTRTLAGAPIREIEKDMAPPRRWMKWVATLVFVFLLLGCSGVLLAGAGGVAVYVAQSMGYSIPVRLPTLPFSF